MSRSYLILNCAICASLPVLLILLPVIAYSSVDCVELFVVIRNGRDFCDRSNHRGIR